MNPRFEPFFQGDTYDTPADMPRDLADVLCLGGSAWFYTLLSRIVFTSRAKALAGTYDDEAWAESSIEVMRSLDALHAGHPDIEDETTGPLVRHFLEKIVARLEYFVFEIDRIHERLHGESDRRIVVDDEDLIRWSLRARLEEEGYDVAEAADGAEAIRLMRTMVATLEDPEEMVLNF